MNIRDNPLYVATQPEILRVNQKDEEYKDLLKAKLVDGLDLFTPKIVSHRILAKNDDLLKMIAGGLYYGLTWLKSSPTLGEEYSGLQPFSLGALKKNGEIKMPQSVKILFLILHLVIPYGATTIFKKFYNRLISQQQETAPKSLWSVFLRSLPEYHDLIDKIFRLNLAIFFLRGYFFRLSNRFLQIGYHFKGQPSVHGIDYSKVGLLMVVQMTIESIQYVWGVTSKYIKMRKEEITTQQRANNTVNHSQLTEVEDSEASKCQLCFDTLKDASATPCGHIFCWECIVKGLFIKQECPNCRKPCRVNEIIHLRNYMS